MKFYESPNVLILNLVIESPVLIASGDTEDMDSILGAW